MKLKGYLKSIFSANKVKLDTLCGSPYYTLLNLDRNSPQFHEHYKKFNYNHPQLELCCPFLGEIISVDVGISELLQLLWEDDIKTFNSCQENKPGYMWIAFLTMDDAINFINTVVKPIFEKEDWEYENELYSRIVDDSLPFGWRWDICIDSCFTQVDDVYINKLPMDFDISVRFPIADYNTVISLFKQGRKLPDTW